MAATYTVWCIYSLGVYTDGLNKTSRSYLEERRSQLEAGEREERT